jgi:hypothetical protein
MSHLAKLVPQSSVAITSVVVVAVLTLASAVTVIDATPTSVPWKITNKMAQQQQQHDVAEMVDEDGEGAVVGE